MGESTGKVLFLHLGASKTATTYLQKEVFPRFGFLRYFDQPSSNLLSGSSYHGMLASAFKRLPIIWEKRGDELFEELLGPSLSRGESRDVLISDQSAGPAMWETGPYAGSPWKKQRQDPFSLRLHLQALGERALEWGFGDLRVFLMFRRQDEWIASKYAQRSDRILKASQDHFEERIDYYLDRSRGYFADGVVLDYVLLRDQLIRAVGEENVLMLPYELFKTDPTSCLQHLIDFLDPGENYQGHQLSELSTKGKKNVRSKSESTWGLRPRSLRHLSTPSWLPGRMIGILNRTMQIASRLFRGDQAIKLTPALRKKILTRYESTNRKLDREVNFPLDEYGYFPEQA